LDDAGTIKFTVYIRGRTPKRRTALIVGVIAFIATLIVVFGYAILRQPDRIAASFPLPDLITRTPTLIGGFEATTTRLPTETRPPTNTRTPTPTGTPMATVAPTKTPYPQLEHFLFGRPVLPEANQFPERFYGYGTTGRGDYEVHRGTDFVNPFGTTIVAVANGTVVVAGNDMLPQCGAGGNEVCGQYPDFYGNVIILKLDENYQGQPVYVAYGHMQTVFVRPGQRVSALEPLGEVGQEGIAVGPHVHIEVRYGANSYATTRNPILWMRPLQGTGALAGRLQDKNGNPLRAQSILVYADDIDGTYIGDTETYARDEAPPVNSDDVLQENWAFPDLPAGTYVIRAYVGSLQYSRRVTVQPGKLTFVVFGG
jgi:murein DD-endopeptidase MepM/ murein hydrolase activator NlpD